MKMCRRVAVIAIAFVLVGSTAAWSEEPGLSQDDIDTLCEIYKKIPVEKTIRINSVTKRRVKPIAVHRCQEVVFRVVGGDAAISIMDDDIAKANTQLIKSDIDAVTSNAVVLKIARDRRDPPSIVVPKEYPNPGHDVTVSFFTKCFDPETNETYECQGGSAPIIIIPRFP